MNYTAIALEKITPNSKWVLTDGVEIEWDDKGIPKNFIWLDDQTKCPSRKEIETAILEVKTEIENKKYIEKRLKDYPSIGDQLDALFKAGLFPEDMAAQIQAVKDKYPKPE